MKSLKSRYRGFLLAVVLAFVAVTPLQALGGADHTLKSINITETLTNGQTFQGRLTITSLTLSETGDLLASGILKGKLNGTVVRQAFSDVTAAFSETPTVAGSEGVIIAQSHTVCDVLFLDLGPIFLDLLGLEVDLSEIELDIDAVPGAGNLVGNLLCAVVNLLNGFELGSVAGIINNLLAIINDLL